MTRLKACGDVKHSIRHVHFLLYLFTIPQFIMKIIRLLLLMFLSQQSFAQGDKEFIYQQFNKIAGSWEGFMEYTDESDNVTKYSLPAKCQSTFNGTKWEYAVQYDHGRGDITGGKGECTINDDGNKMNYDGIIWDITAIDEHGDTTEIVIETKGKEKRRPTDLRRTIMITSVGFFITEEVRAAEFGPNFIVRNRHIFRRPARSKD
jgi:hypothetical protein